MALAGAGGLLAWQHTAPAPWTRVGLAWAALAACVVAALSGTLRMAEGRLQWNGQIWRFEATQTRGDDRELSWTPAEVAVALDLQSVVLLSVRGTPAWVWLRAASDPPQWDDLRRALRAHSRGTGSDP